MKIIDARKLECPKPVIMLKNHFSNNKDESVCILVDNFIASENIKKFSKNAGYKVTINENNNEYKLLVSAKEQHIDLSNIKENKKNIKEKILLITSDFLGDGDIELGYKLMESFIYTITESDFYPNKIILVNSAVKLVDKNSKVLEDLQLLEKEGVIIESCGICINYYDIDYKAGQITNMYSIYNNILEKDMVKI